MSNLKEKSIKSSSLLKVFWDDYSQLVKLRLTITVVFSSVMAFILVSDYFTLLDMLILATGGYAITATANILNEVLEKDFDKLMSRTKNRPLATGRMNTSYAVLIAGIHALIGLFALAYFNPLTVLLGILAIILYAFVYTPLKRFSTVAITVGAIPGALPVLIGTVAYSGTLTSFGLILFGIQFLWQFPHFWAIGWLGHKEYQKAGFKLCPTNRAGEPDELIGIHSAIYALLLIPMASLLYYLGFTSLLILMVISCLSLAFAYFGYKLYTDNSRPAALKLMFASLIYLPLILILLYIDKIIM